MTATPLSSRRWLTKGTSELRRDARLSGDGRYGCDGDLGCICTTMCAGHGRGGWTTMQPSASIICREEGDVAAWASVSASRSLRAVPWAKPRHMTNMTTRKVVKPPIRIIATSASRRLAFWGPGFLLGRGVGRTAAPTARSGLAVKSVNSHSLVTLSLSLPCCPQFWNPRARHPPALVRHTSVQASLHGHAAMLCPSPGSSDKANTRTGWYAGVPHAHHACEGTHSGGARYGDRLTLSPRGLAPLAVDRPTSRAVALLAPVLAPTLTPAAAPSGKVAR